MVRSTRLAALLWLAAAIALIATSAPARPAHAQIELEDRLVNLRPRLAAPPSSRRTPRLRATGSGLDSIWIGHSIQTVNPLDHSTWSYGPWRVGRGNNRPHPSGSAADNSGLWDWDHFVPGESDSLQGWWPMRRAYSITGGLTIVDDQRPRWAVDIGNQGNYVMGAQGRTFGVLSYWHVDGGNKNNPPPFNGNALNAMTWAPLDGNASAWCGVRGHGDFTYLDPITGNPYNASVLEMLGENGGGTGSGVGTNKHFPGYPGQMDQMLYRDVEVTQANATLDLSFLYRTVMSTGTTTTASIRTGWFQFDPTVVGPVAAPGPNAGLPNYVANTGIGQPADSFMVYVGMPVNVDDLYLADGSHKTAGVTPHGVYDLRRRWFSEVLALDKPIRELFHTSGTTGPATASFPAVDLSPYWAAGSNQPDGKVYVRVVFRVKTNRGFDDMTGGMIGSFNSGGEGAARIDDVAIGGVGVAGPALGTSGFESAGDIGNAEESTHLALGSWHATGKPPAVFFHAHPLAGGDLGGGNVYPVLTYQDICDIPGTAQRFCNLTGVVISAGDHDHDEAAGGLVAGLPERERMDGILSPTILLASSGSGDFNAMGIDRDDATTTDDYYVVFDLYAGIFNLMFTGNAWTFGFQSYPAQQLDGPSSTLQTYCWGEIRYPGFQLTSADLRCIRDFEVAKGNGLIRTTNPGSRPDSMRIFLGKNQQCFRFGVTGSACSPTQGAYFDNVSLLLSDAPYPNAEGSPIIGDIWTWFNDTFPANDGTSVAPGVAVQPGTAAFDTAAAYIKSGLNTAQSTGDANRFDIPGDSLVIVAGQNIHDRVDMVFRIKPGVGNYHVIGDPSSGLRPVPTDPVNVVSAGDNSFWGQYLAQPGAMSSGVHGNPGVGGPGGGANWWNKNVWNSARIDTAEINLYPIQTYCGFDCNFNFAVTAYWMATYHELDPKWNTLGITHNKCFVVNPGGPQNSTNITCSGTIPPGVGYDPATPTTTKEGTKIIPDGQLTPGAHVEYFFRLQDADVGRDDVHFSMDPDTNFVVPQNEDNQGANLDGHRWQQFGVLPDRWKDPLFGGFDMACMLYVDLDDRRGNERVWVGITDSLGLTFGDARGNHNGWRANCNECLTDAAGNAVAVGGDPAIARYDHGGQPGTLWDMYGVKAAESLTNSAGQLGSRLATTATGLAAGKGARLGPTRDMLRTYYRALVILTGDLSAGILGPFTNRSQNDVALLVDYLSNTAPSGSTPRAIWIAGDGFVQSEYATGSTGTFASHLSLLTDYLGVTIRRDGGGNPQFAYQPWAGNAAPYAELDATGPAVGTYSVGNACLWGNDVLDPVANGLGAQPSATYENVGANGPYVAAVSTPVQTGKRYASEVEGWSVEHLFTWTGAGGPDTRGRIYHAWNIWLSLVAGTPGCPRGEPFIVDVPGGDRRFANYLALWNNPMTTGLAIVRFGLARADRVQLRIYDVSGRLVRTLADRAFPAGDHELRWDGADDRGRGLGRGVYFMRARYASTGFEDARKVVVLH
jgi:hypothetical protein